MLLRSEIVLRMLGGQSLRNGIRENFPLLQNLQDYCGILYMFVSSEKTERMVEEFTVPTVWFADHSGMSRNVRDRREGASAPSHFLDTTPRRRIPYFSGFQGDCAAYGSSLTGTSPRITGEIGESAADVADPNLPAGASNDSYWYSTCSHRNNCGGWRYSGRAKYLEVKECRLKLAEILR